MAGIRGWIDSVSGGMALRARRARWLLLAGVVTALGLIVVASVALDIRTSQLRAETEEVVQPVRDLIDEIEFRLARQMALLRGFALTRDPRFVDAYAESRRLEAAAWSRLLRRGHELGPEVERRIHELRERVMRWHALIEARGPQLGPAPPEEAAVLLEAELYDEILESFVALANAVDTHREALIAEMQMAETVHSVIAFLLSLIAVAGAAGATWLIGRTQELAAEAERRRAETERLAQSRVRLMRGLTHDVKNPLSAAAGYAELLELDAATKLAAEQRAWLRRIGGAVSAAAAILDDLLELSRAEAGQIALRPEPVQVVEAVRDAAAEEEAQFAAAGIELRVEAPDVPPPVVTDRARLRQVLGNLLSNARKYTPRDGRVTIRVGVRSDPAAPGPGPWLSVDVMDTGPGIPPAKRETIFDEFIRLEPGTAPGIGLGLPISRRLATLMGGDLTVDSEPGAGSTFTLWLPLLGLPRRREAA